MPPTFWGHFYFKFVGKINKLVIVTIELSIKFVSGKFKLKNKFSLGKGQTYLQ
jgi:hypothetical protein